MQRGSANCRGKTAVFSEKHGSEFRSEHAQLGIVALGLGSTLVSVPNCVCSRRVSYAVPNVWSARVFSLRNASLLPQFMVKGRQVRKEDYLFGFLRISDTSRCW